MKLAAFNLKIALKAVLLVMFFMTATKIGFNIGYASGAGQAHSKAVNESRLFYRNFIDKLKTGKAFKLWSMKMVPVNGDEAQICKDNKKWIGAGNAEDFNLRYADSK